MLSVINGNVLLHKGIQESETSLAYWISGVKCLHLERLHASSVHFDVLCQCGAACPIEICTYLYFIPCGSDHGYYPCYSLTLCVLCPILPVRMG